MYVCVRHSSWPLASFRFIWLNACRLMGLRSYRANGLAQSVGATSSVYTEQARNRLAEFCQVPPLLLLLLLVTATTTTTTNTTTTSTATSTTTTTTRRRRRLRLLLLRLLRLLRRRQRRRRRLIVIYGVSIYIV